MIDDQGTSQTEATEILRKLRDLAFDASDEKLAVALGRKTEEVSAWINEPGEVDADLLIKARGIAVQRGIQIDQPENQ